MKKQQTISLGIHRAPAIVILPEATEVRSLLIIIHGGGVGYDKRWALKWLPVNGFPIVGVYVDLPLHGERMVKDLRERYRRDIIMEFLAPVILGMSNEIPSIIDDLLELTKDYHIEHIGICGWSVGGLTAFLAAVHENRIKTVAGFAIPVAADYLNLEQLPNDRKRLAVLDKLVLINKAKDLYPRALLLLHGLLDNRVNPESSRLLYRMLKPRYSRFPEKLRIVQYQNISHDPCSSGIERLLVIRKEILNWFVVNDR